jgi:hypothetical protein
MSADPLARSTLQMVDLAEQPDLDYVVFPPSGDRSPVMIDSWTVTEDEFTGYREGDIVIAMRADTPWIVYHKSMVRRLTRRENIEQGLAHTKGEYEIKTAFMKKLSAEEAEMAAGDERVVTVESPTGQYL